MGHRRADRELFWHGVLQRQAASGLSVAKFCLQEAVSVPSFYAWRRKLQKEAAVRENEVPVAASVGVGRQLLPVRIEVERSASLVRILLPHGVSLEASSSIDRRALVELLAALREAQ